MTRGRIIKRSGTSGDAAAGGTQPHSGGAAGSDEAVAALAALRRAADEALLQSRHAALLLARKMAERIIGHAVALDEAAITSITAQALAACRDLSGTIRLRVHPLDLQQLERDRAPLVARLPKATVQFIADESVGRYGCLIETPAGRIDARIGAQLDAFERALVRSESGRAKAADGDAS